MHLLKTGQGLCLFLTYHFLGGKLISKNKGGSFMRRGKIIPIILFLVLVLGVYGEAVPESVIRGILATDMPRTLHVNIERGRVFKGIKGDRIDLSPVPLRIYCIEGLTRSRQKVSISA
jgi:hypothetical protein